MFRRSVWRLTWGIGLFGLIVQAAESAPPPPQDEIVSPILSDQAPPGQGAPATEGCPGQPPSIVGAPGMLVHEHEVMDEPHSGPPCVVAGLRTWLSWADSERSHLGDSLFPSPDFVTKLRWRRMASEVIEGNINTLLFDRLLLGGEIGAGAISGGRLRNSDIVSDSIHSAIDDDLFYLNVDVGWRFCECECFSFDGLIGYQFWRERYVAEGGVSVPPIFFPPGPVIEEEFNWQGFRLGFQGMLQPDARCVVKARVMFMPLTHLEINDVHRFPIPFRLEDSAGGGFGVMAEVKAAYNLWKGLFVELGYRIWDISSSEGETSIVSDVVPDAKLPFNGGHTTRQGLLFSFSWLF